MATAADPGGLRESIRGASLSSRVIAGSAVLAVIVAAAFGVLVYAVSTLDDATRRERHAKAVTATTLQRTNTELWRTIAGIGLLALMFEWWYYHRRTV